MNLSAGMSGRYSMTLQQLLSQEGFTLIEVLVAFLLLALMGGLLLQAYQGALTGADSSRQLSRGVLVSESLMAALRSQSRSEPGEYRGTFDGDLSWHLQLTPQEITGVPSRAKSHLLKASLDVEWAPLKHYHSETLLVNEVSHP